jgi:CheY-like chemotaxis protein
VCAKRSRLLVHWWGVKLLIVAGPYEADRIRRAAVLAGFEAVAVEPGESLSGWITATRPDVIVLAPQIVNPDPAVALAKVRAVPRGRVPIFLVGEADEEAQLSPLADGFFVRPVSPDELLTQAQEAMAGAGSRATDDQDPGTHAVIAPIAAEESDGTQTKARTLRPLVAARDPDALKGAHARDAGARQASAHGELVVPDDPVARRAAGREGVVPTADHEPTRVSLPTADGKSRDLAAQVRGRASTMFADLAESIEADFDAEIGQIVRAVDVLRQASVSRNPSIITSTDTRDGDAVDELKDDGSEKTLEVPHALRSALADSERVGPVGARRMVPGLPSEPDPTPEPDEIDLDLPSLFARMYLSRLSGRLTLKQGKTSKHIVFERGHPVLAGSTLVGDRMGEMLVRQGRFTAAEMSACGAEVASSGRRLGVVLVERGLLKAVDLSALVRRHYEEIIYSLFAWDRGAWNLGTDNSAAAEKILLSQHPAALILEGVRRKYDAERLLTCLGGADVAFRLRLTTGAADLLEKMETTSEERNLVLLFDGVRSLRQIQALTRVSAERLYGVAWALFVLERLHVSDAAHGREASSTMGVPSHDVSEGRDEAIDRSSVQTRHALVMDGDYFQILGVSRDASTQEILRAHETMAAQMVPDVLHAAVVADLASELAEIRAVLAEAAHLLTDERLRRRYRDHLPPPRGSGSDAVAGF